MKIKCTECGSEKLEPGRLSDASHVSFVPSHIRFLATTSTVKICAFVCVECGHLMLQVDTEELRAKAAIPEDDEVTK